MAYSKGIVPNNSVDLAAPKNLVVSVGPEIKKKKLIKSLLLRYAYVCV